MTILLIIAAVIIVSLLVILSLYTSVNSYASKFENWIENLLDGKDDSKK